MIHTSVFNSIPHKYNLSVVKMDLNYETLTSTSSLDGLNQKSNGQFCTLSKKQTICLAVTFGILLKIAILAIVAIGFIFAGAMNVAQH